MAVTAPARAKLRALFEQEPNPCAHWTLQELGDLVGVSRQRVAQLVGSYVALPAADRKLAAFLEERPEGMLTKARGGMSMSEIATALGVCPQSVSVAWKRLALPPRSLQWMTEAERRQASRDWLYTVIRQETCITCGRHFDWTRVQESGHGRGMQRIVCSRLCGRIAAQREREEKCGK